MKRRRPTPSFNCLCVPFSLLPSAFFDFFSPPAATQPAIISFLPKPDRQITDHYGSKHPKLTPPSAESLGFCKKVKDGAKKLSGKPDGPGKKKDKAAKGGDLAAMLAEGSSSTKKGKK